MDIRIKDYRVLEALMAQIYHAKLMALIVWASARYSIIMLTSAYRDGDEGVHGTTPCRAIDIRSTWYKSPAKIVDDINNHWEYDYTRPKMQCALLHDVGKGVHIHLQTCDVTKFFKDGRGGIDVAYAGTEMIPTEIQS